MSFDLIDLVMKDPHLIAMLQGSGGMLLLAVVRGWSKNFDESDAVEKYRPYLEKGLIILTLLVAVLKAALEGNAAGAPWDQVLNTVMFWIGAKAVGTQKLEKVVNKGKLKLTANGQ